MPPRSLIDILETDHGWTDQLKTRKGRYSATACRDYDGVVKLAPARGSPSERRTHSVDLSGIFTTGSMWDVSATPKGSEFEPQSGYFDPKGYYADTLCFFDYGLGLPDGDCLVVVSHGHSDVTGEINDAVLFGNCDGRKLLVTTTSIGQSLDRWSLISKTPAGPLEKTLQHIRQEMDRYHHYVGAKHRSKALY